MLLEQANMSSEDPLLSAREAGGSVPAKLSHHFVNVSPNADVLHRRDSNADLQRSEPDWYGPFLAEGERYKTPRTLDNWRKACQAVGLDDLSEEDKPEREFYLSIPKQFVQLGKIEVW